MFESESIYGLHGRIDQIRGASYEPSTIFWRSLISDSLVKGYVFGVAKDPGLPGCNRDHQDYISYMFRLGGGVPTETFLAI